MVLGRRPPPSICASRDHHPIRAEDLRRLTVLETMVQCRCQWNVVPVVSGQVRLR